MFLNLIKRINEKDNLYNFFILTFISLLYSILINPHSQEAVTFAHIARIDEFIKYFENWQSSVKNQPFTFQIIIPFILLSCVLLNVPSF